MEKNIFDFFFHAFIVFHQQVGLLIMVLLLLWLMSGRRPDAWTYTGIFFKTINFIIKKSLKICESAAKTTAASLPTKYAKWRPLVKVMAQPIYCVFVVTIIVLAISKCAQS